MEALAVAAPYLQAAGTAFSVIGALNQGRAASDAANYNAAVASRNAVVAQQQAAADAERQRRENVLRQGQIRAGYGASGVTLEGSPLDVLENSAAMGELDRQTILYKGRLRSMGSEETAALDVMQGENAITQSYLRAGSELFTGASKAKAGGAQPTPRMTAAGWRSGYDLQD